MILAEKFLSGYAFQNLIYIRWLDVAIAWRECFTI